MSKKFAALLCHLIIRASSKLRHQDSINVNAPIRIFFGKRSLVSEQGREIKALTEANEDNEERLYYPIQLKLEIFVSFVAYCEISATDPNCQNARYFAGIYSVSRQLWECVRVLASLWEIVTRLKAMRRRIAARQRCAQKVRGATGSPRTLPRIPLFTSH
jgi:hypothetical protein